MRAMWSVVFVLAACGGGKSNVKTSETASEKTTAAAPTGPAPVSDAAASDAAKLNEDGKQSMFANKTEDAEVKFRSALALDPKPLYAFNLCVAQFQLGKLAEAKTACKSAAAAPDEALAGKATKMLAKIDDEAKKQGVALPP